MLIVICTHNGKQYTPERDEDHWDWDGTVKSISEGNWPDVTQVIHAATGNDVTGLIAEECSRIWAETSVIDREPLADWQKDFLKEHLRVRRLEAAE